MDPVLGITHWTLTTHARLEMHRRGISHAHVALVLALVLVLVLVLGAPEQRFAVRLGRDLFQRRVAVPGRSPELLFRAFVDVDHSPPDLFTIYNYMHSIAMMCY